MSAIKAFPHAEKYLGADINAAHLQQLKASITTEGLDVEVDVIHANFFDMNWDTILPISPFLVWATTRFRLGKLRSLAFTNG